ncbi:MAG: PEP-CTERM sorting domain-containing protein, partial [Thermoguttaceae bacterium]
MELATGSRWVFLARTGPFFLDHALLWSGTAASAVDLHQFLPAEFIASVAKSIDDQGKIVGTAYDSSGDAHAILWTPVPEPATIVLLGMAAMITYGSYVGRDVNLASTSAIIGAADTFVALIAGLC